MSHHASLCLSNAHALSCIVINPSFAVAAEHGPVPLPLFPLSLLMPDDALAFILQSLLNKGQSRWAKEMLGNVRKACCVAGVMALVPKDDDVREVRLLAMAC
jgi:hypothetical protein